MISDRWDVSVIGGGPAGCSAAISLAKRGFRVILFEAKTYPHDKLCGEFLSPECAGHLQALGTWDAVQALGPVEIKRVRLSAPDGTRWESRLPGTALGVSRKALDAALADQARRAGVEVREATSIERLRGSLSQGFELEGNCRDRRVAIRSRAVIAAHGKRAALDRSLERAFLSQRQPFVAIKAHFHGPPVPGRVDLNTFPGGYCGFSEIEEGARVVCLLAHQRVFEARRGSGSDCLDHFVDWMVRQNPALQSWMAGAERIHPRWITIAQVPFGIKPAVERDVLMAGDAAGLIAPFAGNGVAMALGSGRMAADHLAAFLSGNASPEMLKYGYTSAWQARYARRVRIGQVVQPLMLSPLAAPLALRLLQIFPGAGLHLIEQTRDPVLPMPVEEDRRVMMVAPNVAGKSPVKRKETE